MKKHDVVLVDFGNKNKYKNEIKKQHYAIVVSTEEFYEITGLIIVAPISTKKGNRNNEKSFEAHRRGFHPNIKINGRGAYIATEQLRTIDPKRIIPFDRDITVEFNDNNKKRLENLLKRFM